MGKQRHLACERCETCGQRIKTIGVHSEHLPTRFWSKVDIDVPDKCWPWLGADSGRYGSFTLNGKSQSAHRVAWILMYGEPWDAKLVICHKCDNPKCCNPNHLFLGYQSDNMLDCSRKGRHRPDLKMTSHES